MIGLRNWLGSVLYTASCCHSILHLPSINMASHVYKMGVHKMIEVESMANWTENVPKYLVWTPKNILRASFWAGVFPYALFKFTLPFYVRNLLRAEIRLNAALSGKSSPLWLGLKVRANLAPIFSFTTIYRTKLPKLITGLL